MRPMVLEFPHDPGAATVDTQYMLGENLLVAPVFSAAGDVDVYVPEGVWTSLLTGEQVTGPRWVHEVHGFDSVPLYVRPDSVLPVGCARRPSGLRLGRRRDAAPGRARRRSPVRPRRRRR